MKRLTIEEVQHKIKQRFRNVVARQLISSTTNMQATSVVEKRSILDKMMIQSVL